ncbi:glutathione ABC transporter ATP-binding protein GsiA, partial [Escherichia coli]
ASDPKLIIADEALSALDVSIQAQIINLFMDLQAERGLAYLFISHDLAVVRAMAHNILVLKDGKVVEQGECEALLENPQSA